MPGSSEAPLHGLPQQVNRPMPRPDISSPLVVDTLVLPDGLPTGRRQPFGGEQIGESLVESLHQPELEDATKRDVLYSDERGIEESEAPSLTAEFPISYVDPPVKIPWRRYILQGSLLVGGLALSTAIAVSFLPATSAFVVWTAVGSKVILGSSAAAAVVSRIIPFLVGLTNNPAAQEVIADASMNIDPGGSIALLETTGITAGIVVGTSTFEQSTNDADRHYSGFRDGPRTRERR